MSGLDVIGGISAIIGIIDASIKIYDSAQKDLKLSETFKAVGRRLPIILDTLQTCKNHLEPIKDTIPTDVCEALEKVLEVCDEKAGRLRQIFEKVIPGEHEVWKKRYLKIVRRLGKGNKVEELMASITEDVQLVVNHHAVQSAQPEQNAELKKIIKEMKSVKPSVPEEESCAMSFESGGGAQTNNVNSGSGQQVNNNAPVTTQNFNSGKD
jgi:N-terminal domain on NACHT_NTPase and P-loop NTPases